MTHETVCPRCGGKRDAPRIIRPTNDWNERFLCDHAYHRGEAPGLERNA